MKTNRSAAIGRPPKDAEQGDDRKIHRYWGSVEPPKSKVEFFSAVTAPAAADSDATVATIRMYGPIDSWGGWWGISTEDVGHVLDALPESVEQIVLRINSPGGEVWEAMAILNMFAAHRANVVAVVDGLAASAASFIAASCDETVMSPGSQMMIHSPSSIAWGNAVEMRKTADFLDKLQESMIEVYTAKAGVQDWATLLGEETWLSAADTVALGLADRVGVVPDAGTAKTVGDEDEVILVAVDPDEDADAEARSARVHAAAASARAAAPKPPSSSEPGTPNQKEELTMSDTIKAGLRERLGVTDAEASDETLLAALDEALEEQAETPETPVSELPAGAIVVDKGAHEKLQQDAAAGRKAMDAIDGQRRDGIVAKALKEGRIAANSAEGWRAQLDKDEEGISNLLNSFPANTVPVTEVGKADTVHDADDSLYAKAGWGNDNTKEA